MFGWLVRVSGAGDIVLNQTLHGGDGSRGLARSVEPAKIRLFAEPDQLAPRVAAVLLCNQRARRRLVAHAAQVLERLAVDQAAERTRRFGDAARQQRADLVEQALLELLVDP